MDVGGHFVFWLIMGLLGQRCVHGPGFLGSLVIVSERSDTK